MPITIIAREGDNKSPLRTSYNGAQLEARMSVESKVAHLNDQIRVQIAEEASRDSFAERRAENLITYYRETSAQSSPSRLARFAWLHFVENAVLGRRSGTVSGFVSSIGFLIIGAGVGAIPGGHPALGAILISSGIAIAITAGTFTVMVKVVEAQLRSKTRLMKLRRDIEKIPPRIVRKSNSDDRTM